jgi:hypothetical protein
MNRKMKKKHQKIYWGHYNPTLNFVYSQVMEPWHPGMTMKDILLLILRTFMDTQMSLMIWGRPSNVQGLCHYSYCRVP